MRSSIPARRVEPLHETVKVPRFELQTTVKVAKFELPPEAVPEHRASAPPPIAPQPAPPELRLERHVTIAVWVVAFALAAWLVLAVR